MAMSGALMAASAAGAQGVQSTANLAGQILANQANRAATGKQMRWQDANIQKAMDFQREMSGSVYQRAVADMKKAGINPMLLASKGMSPSPAPSGGGAGTSSPIKQDPITTGLSNAFTSALDLVKTQAETDKIRAQTKLTDAERENKQADYIAHLEKSKALGEAGSAWQMAKNLASGAGRYAAGTAYTWTHRQPSKVQAIENYIRSRNK
jgi:hypothetical protein